MARLCKSGGFLINSMTKQYSEVDKPVEAGYMNHLHQLFLLQFVEEYKGIDRYIEELAEEGKWKIVFRRILGEYTKNNQGLVHAMKIM